MSPLLVSQVLPAERIFDVVIFDEASQVEPVDGITAIMRGRQIVVAGDEHQLPPTRFFDRADTDTTPAVAPDDSQDAPLTEDVESLLQSFATALPLAQVKHLAWHYRSRDERLIAFSNSHIYAPNGNALTTFPGMLAAGSLTYVLAEPEREVQTVVDLILGHAQDRPTESLGVITMGVAQAERVDAALRQALSGRSDLHAFFSDTRAEPFFVKNIERVQGDERDAIILSVGYGKTADGRMAYRFGPLNITGGHRRLNVAITRSKRRMTVVSSFSYAEMDPARLHGDGARMLRAYLEFAETGAVRGAAGQPADQQLNPFERDVRDRLAQAGIPLVARYGVSGLRIDFAAAHPRRPGEMVLAIETDGPSYQASATVRDRDRLRPEHLGRLGWRYHRIWSTDWFRDRTREIARLRAAYEEAVAAVDAGQADTIAMGPGDTMVDLAAVESDPSAATTQVLAPPSAQAAGRPAPQRRLERPDVRPGQPIGDYDPALLADVIRWIESDGRLRTEEDLLDEAIEVLGFSRRGQRIVAALRQAIIDARTAAA
jgi:very-short-patch-repair endonuclease